MQTNDISEEFVYRAKFNLNVSVNSIDNAVYS